MICIDWICSQEQVVAAVEVLKWHNEVFICLLDGSVHNINIICANLHTWSILTQVPIIQLWLLKAQYSIRISFYDIWSRTVSYKVWILDCLEGIRVFHYYSVFKRHYIFTVLLLKPAMLISCWSDHLFLLHSIASLEIHTMVNRTIHTKVDLELVPLKVVYLKFSHLAFIEECADICNSVKSFLPYLIIIFNQHIFILKEGWLRHYWFLKHPDMPFRPLHWLHLFPTSCLWNATNHAETLTEFGFALNLHQQLALWHRCSNQVCGLQLLFIHEGPNLFYFSKYFLSLPLWVSNELRRFKLISTDFGALKRMLACFKSSTRSWHMPKAIKVHFL